MRIDRNAAPVVGHGEEPVRSEFHLDKGGVARQSLVHRVVDDFGEQVVQRLLVGAADIHARPPADRLETLENLDIRGGVVGFGPAGTGGDLQRRAAFRLRGSFE